MATKVEAEGEELVEGEFCIGIIEVGLKNISGIYSLSINNKIYIGSACNLYNRLHTHKSLLLKGVHGNQIIQRSFNKYKKLQFSILELCKITDLISREQHYMDVLHPKLNIRKIAYSNLGLKVSEETKRKHSISTKNWHKEYGFSRETKLKMSKAALGKVISTEQREKLRQANIGKVLSIETKKYLSLYMRKERMTNPNYKNSILKGEKNGQSKLQDIQVVEIRDRIEQGERGVHLAKEFGVTVSCISLIKRKLTYKHLITG